MPDQRNHRGPNPEDQRDFANAELPKLVKALADFSWLLSRGYAHRSGIKLVGDRYELTARQRTAVQRCACSDQERSERASREIPVVQIAGKPLWIDGFNLLTTVEAALGRGVVLACRDGCFRDMASMSGHFKLVQETAPALALIANTLQRLGPSEVVWMLDSPVSNSARLAEFIRQVGKAWGWRVGLVNDPDPLLRESNQIVVTADSAILDAGVRWVNLAGEIVSAHLPHPWVVRLLGK